ncbi:hypothetical protein Q8B06_000234 [Salmonella enterica]|jgi:hypothetical protein|uniref:hypothetical protein n=1 Tax=Salmonella enterica TaxID=28901 RepID=UPI0015B596C9|nr:hypothetical protein [Salmonella enterica]EEQ9412282.1 hypothetical protein [Escherichia coli]EIG1171196.1 hypothetical protein [Salmonella enterica subsp. diarizonae serovar 48:k:z53]DAV97659.1 MAG TPA: hypothetical protein [Inoviridae sp.]EDT1279321.1 hypothetical protein [Salmonella enterica]EEM0617438.1 hypothetical protein [Salmonella enterica]
MANNNTPDSKKNTPQRVMVHDGLDTSTAKMMLNSIKKEQESQAKVSNSNKEGKK